MKSNTNTTCAVCDRAHNGLNGRYCDVLKRYVEYEKSPICKQ